MTANQSDNGLDLRSFEWGSRTLVMGILNLSPDSFSGDGINAGVEYAVQRARELANEGADIIDVGGQSTRPGHEEISVEEELRRVHESITAVASEVNLPISIDTYRAPVAEAALDAGASILNDIRGLTADPDLVALAAERDVPVVLMHDIQIRDQSRMIPQIVHELSQRIDHALNQGIDWERIIIDPGFGFGKQTEMNLELLRRIGELRVFGRPILVGISRKRTIGEVLGTEPDDRVEGTSATTALAIANGADVVRIHDVRQMVRVTRMADAVVRGNWCEHTSG